VQTCEAGGIMTAWGDAGIAQLSLRGVMVAAGDLKSLGRETVPVRVRPQVQTDLVQYTYF